MNLDSSREACVHKPMELSSKGVNLRTQPDLELACDKQKINPTQHAINLEIQWLVVIPKKIKIKKLSFSHTHTHHLSATNVHTVMSKYFLKKRHLNEGSGFPDKGKKKSSGFPILLFYPNLFLPREEVSLPLYLSHSLTDSQNMFFFIPSTHVVSITFTLGSC